MVALIMIN